MATSASPNFDAFCDFNISLPPNHYQVLGINLGANEDDIRKAFRFKARQVHPDKNQENPQAEEWMKQVNKAYEILSDRIKRTEYDESLLTDDKEAHGVFEPLPSGTRHSQHIVQMISVWMQVIRNSELGQFPEALKRDLNKVQDTLKTFIHSRTSPSKGNEVKKSYLDIISLALDKLVDNPSITREVSNLQDTLEGVLQHLRSNGCRHMPNKPQKGDVQPIISLSGATQHDLQSLWHLFMMSDQNNSGRLSHTEMVSKLSEVIPKVIVRKPNKPKQESKCASCKYAFWFFSRSYTCFVCGATHCSSCHLYKRIIPYFGQQSPEPICQPCSTRLDQEEANAWVEAGLEYTREATLGSLVKAHACFKVALCSHKESYEPILKFGTELLRLGWPEMALQLAVPLLTSAVPKIAVKANLLVASSLQSLVECPDKEWDEKWVLTLAAKEACCNAEHALSSLESSVMEVPDLARQKADINYTLQALVEENDGVYNLSVRNHLQHLEQAWGQRNWPELLSIATAESDENEDLLMNDDAVVCALEQFITAKEKFIDAMIPEDRSPLLLLRGILKLRQLCFSDGLADIEKAAWSGHHTKWLSKNAVDIILTILSEYPSEPILKFSFLYDTVSNLSVASLLSAENDEGISYLLPSNDELNPPTKLHWPELTVSGVDMIASRKYEQAVNRKVQEGEWSERNAALAYIDLIPACPHPAQIVVCFLTAGLWFLKELKHKVSDSKKSCGATHSTGSATQRGASNSDGHTSPELYAVKKAVLFCLQQALAVSNLVLHPGMQLYTSRLALKAALSATSLAGKHATPEDSELVTQLLRMLIRSCRFCPFWKPPTVTVSEAVLLNIISGRLHSQFILGVQHIQPENLSPLHRSELKYQLYENDLRHVCPLDDSEDAFEEAMEELLRDKGWCFEDVSQLMTSPLSPRSDEGWLLQQQSLGTPMEYASLEGFVLNLDPDRPSIQIIVQPASRTSTGLFSHSDVAEVLQIDPGAAFFSLDQPSPDERFHPFQEFRYGPDDLQNTGFLHTMFETDYLMKSFSVGSEVSSAPPFKQQPCGEGLTANLPQHLRMAIRPMCERGSSRGSIHRFWIQADELIYESKQTGLQVRFYVGKPKMTIRSHPLIPGLDGILQDTQEDDDPDSPEAQFAADMTKHYDELGHYFPMFARLRELVKLQFLSIAVRGILSDLQEKVHRKDLDQMAKRIQRDALQQLLPKIEEMLNNLRREIGVWPAADSESEISSAVELALQMVRSEFHRRHGYWPSAREESESLPLIRSKVRDGLRQKDRNVLSQVVDALMQCCRQGVTRSTMEQYVRHWLSSTSGSYPLSFQKSSRNTSTELRDLICSAASPTREKIVQDITEQHKQVYQKFSQEIECITARPRNPKSNACKWVPAALLQQSISEGVFSLCYGGVLLAPKIVTGHVPSSRRGVCTVALKHAVSATRISNTSSRASRRTNTATIPSSTTRIANTSSLASRRTNTAKKPSSTTGIANTGSLASRRTNTATIPSSTTGIANTGSLASRRTNTAKKPSSTTGIANTGSLASRRTNTATIPSSTTRIANTGSLASRRTNTAKKPSYHSTAFQTRRGAHVKETGTRRGGEQNVKGSGNSGGGSSGDESGSDDESGAKSKGSQQRRGNKGNSGVDGSKKNDSPKSKRWLVPFRLFKMSSQEMQVNRVLSRVMRYPLTQSVDDNGCNDHQKSGARQAVHDKIGGIMKFMAHFIFWMMLGKSVSDKFSSELMGTKPCGCKGCKLCSKLVSAPFFKSKATGKIHFVHVKGTCDTRNVIYLVTCTKTGMQYIGRTKRSLKERGYEHLRSVINQKMTALGRHFQDAECGEECFTIQIIDTADNEEDLIRKEDYWIREAETKEGGINIVNAIVHPDV